ncbi:MAG: hypothetical protein OXD44_05705 [Gammaproteobacteria bacterium]|nr:hypothetical protein [Gammaproteobacteria bacterium]MCY4227658.1 hypothetical protein [Gammaproteobacteria bacterium]MCY4313180.1 hypothetical protein [Gammaproteobacteria bacterium]
MSNQYYETIKRLESMKVSRQYILGWASGYLGNPEIEEQRITEAWQAGYEDGKSRSTDEAESWKE